MWWGWKFLCSRAQRGVSKVASRTTQCLSLPEGRRCT